MIFSYKGLEVECEFSKRVPATWMQPAEGEDCELLEWTVDDIDELMTHLEFKSEREDKDVRDFFRLKGTLPPVAEDKVAAWEDDIEETALGKWRNED